jgi:hypothetical protein
MVHDRLPLIVGSGSDTVTPASDADPAVELFDTVIVKVTVLPGK